jgi:hypothetical protein
MCLLLLSEQMSIIPMRNSSALLPGFSCNWLEYRGYVDSGEQHTPPRHKLVYCTCSQLLHAATAAAKAQAGVLHLLTTAACIPQLPLHVQGCLQYLLLTCLLQCCGNMHLLLQQPALSWPPGSGQSALPNGCCITQTSPAGDSRASAQSWSAA